MFKHMPREEIMNEENKLDIALWDTIEKAESFYSNQDGVYTGMKIDNPLLAYATPIQVYKIKN